MTRKDFELIATALRHARPYAYRLATPEANSRLRAAYDALDSAALNFADALAQVNPRFDRDRFLDAAGMGTTPSR